MPNFPFHQMPAHRNRHVFSIGLVVLAGLAISASAVLNSESINSPRLSLDKDTWRLAIPANRGCWPDCSLSWCAPRACGRFGEWPMAIVPIAAFDKLWMIANSSTWSSADGLIWKQRPSNAQWGERYGMEAVLFKDRLWKMGGMDKTWDNFKNDVWYSADGTDWKLATSHAAWSPRRGHSVIVFDNQMWVIGGAESSGRPDQTPTKILSDVWSSTDGVTWTKVADNAPWLGNDNVVVFHERIWTLGPRGVWHSREGRTWTNVVRPTDWMDRRDNGCAVFDDKIWFFGGLMKQGTVNDVWSSQDGVVWHKSVAPWSPRGAEHSVVFNDKLWIYGGKTGRQEDPFNSEVWQMAKH